MKECDILGIVGQPREPPELRGDVVTTSTTSRFRKGSHMTAAALALRHDGWTAERRRSVIAVLAEAGVTEAARGGDEHRLGLSAALASAVKSRAAETRLRHLR